MVANPRPEFGDLLYHGFANRKMPYEYTGGNLYLYKANLYYKSHDANVQVNELIMPVENIQDVSFYNTLGIVPNGMQITLEDGTTEKFVVNKRKTWKQHIQEVRGV